MTLDLHHPLVLEFPEHRDAIHDLKGKDAHFRRLFDEYHDVDKAIVRIEEEIDPASDARMEELKKRRVHLKDDLLRQVLKAKTA